MYKKRNKSYFHLKKNELLQKLEAQRIHRFVCAVSGFKIKSKILNQAVFTDSSCLSPRPYSRELKLTVSGEQNTDSFECNKPRSVSASSLGGKPNLLIYSCIKLKIKYPKLSLNMTEMFF